jgi:hypothetical protein
MFVATLFGVSALNMFALSVLAQGLLILFIAFYTYRAYRKSFIARNRRLIILFSYINVAVTIICLSFTNIEQQGLYFLLLFALLSMHFVIVYFLVKPDVLVVDTLLWEIILSIAFLGMFIILRTYWEWGLHGYIDTTILKVISIAIVSTYFIVIGFIQRERFVLIAFVLFIILSVLRFFRVNIFSPEGLIAYAGLSLMCAYLTKTDFLSHINDEAKPQQKQNNHLYWYVLCLIGLIIAIL